jgi:hypothetical protein
MCRLFDAFDLRETDAQYGLTYFYVGAQLTVSIVVRPYAHTPIRKEYARGYLHR